MDIPLDINIQQLLEQAYAQYIGLDPRILYLAEASIAVVIVSAIIYFVFKSLSRRDLFKLDLSKYEDSETKHRMLGMAFSTFLYIMKYGIVFPLLVVLWFVAIFLSFFFLSGQHTYQDTLFLTATILASVRIMAYIKEPLAADVAKILPFLLLTTYLLDPAFSQNISFSIDIWAIPLNDYLTFFSFIIILEWILRLMNSIWEAIFPNQEEEEKDSGNDGLQKKLGKNDAKMEDMRVRPRSPEKI